MGPRIPRLQPSPNGDGGDDVVGGGVSALIHGAPENSLALLPCDDTVRRWHREPEKFPDQTPTLLALWSPTSSLMSGRDGVCVYPLPGWWCSAPAAQPAGTGGTGRGWAGGRPTLYHTFSAGLGTGWTALLNRGCARAVTRGCAPVCKHHHLLASLRTQQGPESGPSHVLKTQESLFWKDSVADTVTEEKDALGGAGVATPDVLFFSLCRQARPSAACPWEADPSHSKCPP